MLLLGVRLAMFGTGYPAGFLACAPRLRVRGGGRGFGGSRRTRHLRRAHARPQRLGRGDQKREKRDERDREPGAVPHAA